MKIDFVRLGNSAITPTKGTESLAGFDLYSVKNVYIKLIKTDNDFKIPRGYFGKIYARSSLAVRCSEIGGGIIDADCRGPVVVLFFNFSDKAIEIEKGNRFCQIIFTKIANSPVLREVDNFKEDKTDRGEGSFGSTNKIKHICRQDFCE